MKKVLENKKLLGAVCGGGAAVVLLAIVLVFQLVVRPNQLYQEATEQFAAGNYAEAYEVLQKVPEGKNDTAELIPYYAAHAAFAEGDYIAAAEQFAALGDKWEDCPGYAAYSQAQVDLSNKEYGTAYNAFLGLGDFLDSADMLPECRYRLAVDLLEQKDYAGALERFSALGDYKDSVDQGKECSYQLAVQMLDAKAYGDAYNAFAALGEYKDAVDMLSECRYRLAGELMTAGDLAGALERYDALTGYKDSDTQAKECRYQQATILAAENTVDSLTQAIELFSFVGEYRDAAQKVIDTTAALEEAKRVPYTPSADAFFDVDCTNPTQMLMRAYRVALYGDEDKIRIIKVPNLGYFYHLKLGSLFKYSNERYVEGTTITTSPISSRNTFCDGRYRVTNTWNNGGSVQFGSNGSVWLTCSARRWGNTAIYMYGEFDDSSTHKKFLSNVASGTVLQKKDFDGMVGGAVVFGEYEYIDLSGMRFNEADSLSYVSGTNNKIQAPVICTTNGVRIYFGNYRTGGEVTETYNGIDIYTHRNGDVYIHIKPDIYIMCNSQKGGVVEARQTMRTLIDNYHRP